MTPPDWLAQRGCALKIGPDGKTWYLLIGGNPVYSLVAVPAENRYACVIRQTINGRRIDSPAVYPTREEALQGGFEDLRKFLGWA